LEDEGERVRPSGTKGVGFAMSEVIPEPMRPLHPKGGGSVSKPRPDQLEELEGDTSVSIDEEA